MDADGSTIVLCERYSGELKKVLYLELCFQMYLKPYVCTLIKIGDELKFVKEVRQKKMILLYLRKVPDYVFCCLVSYV